MQKTVDLSATCSETAKQVFVKHLTGWRHIWSLMEDLVGLWMIHTALQGQCVSFPHHEDTRIRPRWAASLNVMSSSPHGKGRNGRNPSYTAAGPQLSSTCKCWAPPVTMNHLPVTVSHLPTQSRLSLFSFFFFYFWEDKHPWPCSSNQLPCCSAKISAHIPVNIIDAETAHVILTVKKCFIKLQLPDGWQVEWWSWILRSGYSRQVDQITIGQVQGSKGRCTSLAVNIIWIKAFMQGWK